MPLGGQTQAAGYSRVRTDDHFLFALRVLTPTHIELTCDRFGARLPHFSLMILSVLGIQDCTQETSLQLILLFNSLTSWSKLITPGPFCPVGEFWYWRILRYSLPVGNLMFVRSLLAVGTS